MSNNVLMITGDMAEAQEVLYPLHRLKEEGYTVDIAAPSRKVLQTVIHDFEPGYDTFTEKMGYLVEANLSFSEVNPQAYDGAIIPGGRAPEHIRNDSTFTDVINPFIQANKPIAFECHAALALIPLGHLKGRRCAAFWSLKPDLEAAGATFVDEEVVVDGNFVTSRAWVDHPGYMKEFIKLLKNQITK